MKGKHDPEKVKYFQSLADLTRVFWEFHKHRIREGEIKFAYSLVNNADTGHTKLEAYDVKMNLMTEFFLSMQNEDPVVSFDFLKYFESAMVETLAQAWIQFAGAYGHNLVDQVECYEPFATGIEGKYPEFSQSPYVRSLFETASDLVETCSGVPTNGHEETMDYGIADVVLSGINHAVAVNIQLQRAKYNGQNISGRIPTVASRLSGVSYDDLSFVDADIGIANNGLMPTYDLFDDSSSSGVNMESLRKYGHGSALGCAANMKVTEQTRQFLEHVTGREVKNTFVYQLANAFDRYVERKIMPWIRNVIPTLEGSEIVRVVVPKYTKLD